MKKKNFLVIQGIAAIVAVTGFMLFSSGIGRVTEVPTVEAGGGSKTFIAVINSGQEVPSNSSNSFGIAHLIFDKTTDMLCFSISYSALDGSETGAHFHGPASAGTNAGVQFALPSGSPKNDCVGPLSKKQRKDLEKGLFYINIHSSTVGSGEIRGQVLPVGK